jgi:hypothetical protein
MEFWFSLLFALGFVVIHLFSWNLKFLHTVPRSRFLSVAGGISVAYVFLHLLPELGMFQSALASELENTVWNFFENHIYLVSMIGLAVFYGLEQMVKSSKRSRATIGRSASAAGIFWVHIASFTLYNALIGYLLVHDDFENLWEMLLFFIALGVHFITNDLSLRATHKEDYDRYGKWILTAAIMAGWTVGVMTEVGELVISLLIAFLIGGIILNVMKEELPEERESSFMAFLAGLVSYSLVLLMM